jgi:hypothetical protein
MWQLMAFLLIFVSWCLFWAVVVKRLSHQVDVESLEQMFKIIDEGELQL